jgi:hypothetical protein
VCSSDLDYIFLHEPFKNRNAEWALLGQTQVVAIKSGLKVANLFGQYDCGSGQRFTEYGSLSSAFAQLRRVLDINNFGGDIYIPFKLGCDRGGGDWNIVYDMIKTLLDNDERTIYICSL